MSPRSTEEVAKIIGVAKLTIERWLAQGKIRFPRTIKVGKRRFRLWSSGDIQRLKRYKAKFYRKGRGRKKKK